MSSSVQTVVSCFPKGTPDIHVSQPLNKWSFTIPGKGFAADYCMTPKLSGASVDPGKAIRISRLKCDRTQCPNCFEWWISERVFDIAFKLECYAAHTEDRPAAITCSFHPDAYKGASWNDYGNLNLRLYRRLRKLGVDAAYRLSHAFRVRPEVKGMLSAEGYAKGSSGHWKGVREDALGYGNLYDYVNLAPHLHVIGFPSFIDLNDDPEIFVKKYGVLETVNDLVGHIRYLLTHCLVRADKDSNEPAQPIGALHGWDPKVHFTPDELVDIKVRVAAAMGLFYDVEKDGISMLPEEPEESEETIDFYPMHRFLNYSAEQNEFADSYIASIPDPVVSSFFEIAINQYNLKTSDTSLPKSERHVFFADLPDPPDQLIVVYDYG